MTRRADWRGDPAATKPREVRKMLRMVCANRNDVFYDLGCGYGKVCMLAASKVKRAVGIEDHYDTYRQALQYVKTSGLAHKIKIRYSNIEAARFGDATIVYTVTMEETYRDGERYERILKIGCRFVTIYLPLIGIKPDNVDYPFFIMHVPFKHARDEQEWATSVLRTKNATPAKLYKKLRSWYGRDYVRKVKRILSKRLKTFQVQKKLPK